MPEKAAQCSLIELPRSAAHNLQRLAGIANRLCRLTASFNSIAFEIERYGPFWGVGIARNYKKKRSIKKGGNCQRQHLLIEFLYIADKSIHPPKKKKTLRGD
jgi:hypothetical protein